MYKIKQQRWKVGKLPQNDIGSGFDVLWGNCLWGVKAQYQQGEAINEVQQDHFVEKESDLYVGAYTYRIFDY